MRYFIHLQYRGTNYAGWQIQNNALTVQEVLDKALSTILREEIDTLGCGRTDAGVHASSFYAHFDAQAEFDAAQLVFKLNRFLPKDIAVFSIVPVHKEAHARFDATSRTYHYKIHLHKSAFLHGLSTPTHLQLNLEYLNKLASLFIMKGDFGAFQRVGGDNKTNICDVRESYWVREGEQLIYTITADRFLRNMVRAVVGTQLDIVANRFAENELPEIIASKDRGKAGTSAPPDGLYLAKIVYPYINDER
ncbi:MAG: tRNA pseudouridine(38-40) synthase TruA [Flavobacteriales bacterium]|nr:tRNA pseudouridine(38-40) synthase TruA [Flavobacteriales bacterium]MDG1767284.1 tRNA pseudouridine(38-40) synthase TruA [Flavobacteriales bacterium]